MALDDLDLEFEDEEEAARRKKGDALHVDVDLEFHVPDSVQRRPNRPGAPPPPAGGAVNAAVPERKPAPVASGAQVKNIDEARAAANARPAVASPMPSKGPAAGANRPVGSVAPPQVQGSAALKAEAMSLPSDLDEHESLEVVELREKLKKTEFDSEVKVQVAEFKAEFLGEMLGDMKLMEHQIGQLLVRINAKHPDLKQEVLMIKKILADYTTKKRK